MVAAALVGVLVLGSCGGSGSSSSSTSTAVTTAQTAKPGLGSLPPPTIPAGGCTPAPAAPRATVTVTVDDRGFTPRCVTVAADQTLRLRNAGRIFHNVVVEDLNANLPAGGTQVWDELGQYFTAGAYLLYSGTESNPLLYPTFHTTLVVTGAS